MKLNKKRLLLAAGALGATGAVATLVAGATFGFFSASTPTVSNTFTAGTVTLAQSAVTSCTIANIQPGDSGTCGFTVTYNGSVSDGALLGVDVGISGAGAGSVANAYSPGVSNGVPVSPAVGLWDSSGNGLQLGVSDGTTTYVATNSINGSAPGTTGQYSVNDLLVNNTAAHAGYAKTFTITWSLPTSANNAYQGANTTITLLVHAVQAGNQTAPFGSCTQGDVCTGLTWS